ncbi:MAG: hypothetical protein ACRYG8_24360 [Janthinobacterium lividum]
MTGRTRLALGAVTALVVAASTAGMLAARPGTDGCTESVVLRLPSPDGRWIATLVHSVCESGPGLSAVVDVVRLASATDRTISADMLSVDTGGDEAGRPRLLWTMDGSIQATIPLQSLLEVMKTTLGSVHLRVRFDPDDPAARAAWLKQHHLDPDAVVDLGRTSG